MHIDIPEDLAADPWFKIVDFLQHNWAVVLDRQDGVKVCFYGDTRGVFDEMDFDSRQHAEDALKRNGFGKYQEDDNAKGFIGLPHGEFHEASHPNGLIYSSGRFWVSE
jgi:hypothetical protein